MMLKYCIGRAETVGHVLVAVRNGALCWLGLTDDISCLQKDFPRAVLQFDTTLQPLFEEIETIVQGRQKKLSIPLLLAGTEFQKAVWHELLKIKRGSTVTYSDIAAMIGKPKAVRAVGSAVGANPVSLLVPCHRVVNKTGNKVSYLWGREIKERLLSLEKL
jgi:O-6-methylguanine DNA methyltransferase